MTSAGTKFENDLDILRQKFTELNQELTRCAQELTRREQELTRRAQELTRREQKLTQREQELLTKNTIAERDRELELLGTRKMVSWANYAK